MSASFYASPLIGATTTLACFAHEIPHEIADYSILIRSGFTKKQALQSQFMTAVGAFVRKNLLVTSLSDFFSSFLPLQSSNERLFIYWTCSDLRASPTGWVGVLASLGKVNLFITLPLSFLYYASWWRTCNLFLLCDPSWTCINSTFIGIAVRNAAVAGSDSEDYVMDLAAGIRQDADGLLGTTLHLADLVIPFVAGGFLYIGAVAVLPTYDVFTFCASC